MEKSKRGGAGFTLVELLLAMVAVQVVFVAAGSLLISHVRSSSNLELAQRQRDNAARLDYLIQVEASEAAEVLDGSALLKLEKLTLPSDCGEAAGRTSLAAFLVPRDEGNYLDSQNVSSVYYYNYKGNVRRCGPRVHRNGVLNHLASLPLLDGVAVRDAQIELVTCQGQSTNSNQLVYRLVYPSGYKPACSIARARTVFIQ